MKNSDFGGESVNKYWTLKNNLVPSPPPRVTYSRTIFFYKNKKNFGGLNHLFYAVIHSDCSMSFSSLFHNVPGIF